MARACKDCAKAVPARGALRCSHICPVTDEAPIDMAIGRVAPSDGCAAFKPRKRKSK
jgi:hypothetical protein